MTKQARRVRAAGSRIMRAMGKELTEPETVAPACTCTHIAVDAPYQHLPDCPKAPASTLAAELLRHANEDVAEHGQHKPLLKQAADRIEADAVEVERLKSLLDEDGMALLDDRDRLREALEEGRRLLRSERAARATSQRALKMALRKAIAAVTDPQNAYVGGHTLEEWRALAGEEEPK